MVISSCEKSVINEESRIKNNIWRGRMRIPRENRNVGTYSVGAVIEDSDEE